MKNTPFLIILALFSVLTLASCGEEIDPNKIYSPKEFHKEYVDGYSMKDGGNSTFDGKAITIEGTIESTASATRDDVSGTELRFVKLGGDESFAKYGVNVLFTGDDEEKAKSLKKGDKVKFEATISDYISMEKTISLDKGKIK